jgi:hypothetical protein
LLPESLVIQLFGQDRVDRARLADPHLIDHRAVARAARTLSACKDSSTQALMAMNMKEEVAVGLVRYLIDEKVKEKVVGKFH